MTTVPMDQQAVFSADVTRVEGEAAAYANPSAQRSVAEATLRTRLAQIIANNESKGITSSASLMSLSSGSILFQHGSDLPQFAASINKLPIALLLLEDLRTGKLTLDQQVSWQADDVRAGFGIYDQPQAALQASIRQLMSDMLNYSGNTAVRALVNYSLAGPQAVNDRLALRPELAITRLTVLGPASFYLGSSTSGESLSVLGELLAGPDSYRDFIFEALTTNIFSYYGVRSQLESDGLISLANKAGILDDTEGNNRHDVGVIYNTETGEAYGYSFLTTARSGDIAGTAQAEHSLDLLGRESLRYAGDKPGQITQPGTTNAQTIPESRIRY